MATNEQVSTGTDLLELEALLHNEEVESLFPQVIELMNESKNYKLVVPLIDKLITGFNEWIGNLRNFNTQRKGVESKSSNIETCKLKLYEIMDLKKTTSQSYRVFQEKCLESSNSNSVKSDRNSVKTSASHASTAMSAKLMELDAKKRMVSAKAEFQLAELQIQEAQVLAAGSKSESVHSSRSSKFNARSNRELLIKSSDQLPVMFDHHLSNYEYCPTSADQPLFSTAELVNLSIHPCVPIAGAATTPKTVSSTPLCPVIVNSKGSTKFSRYGNPSRFGNLSTQSIPQNMQSSLLIDDSSIRPNVAHPCSSTIQCVTRRQYSPSSDLSILGGSQIKNNPVCSVTFSSQVMGSVAPRYNPLHVGNPHPMANLDASQQVPVPSQFPICSTVIQPTVVSNLYVDSPPFRAVVPNLFPPTYHFEVICSARVPPTSYIHHL